METIFGMKFGLLIKTGQRSLSRQKAIGVKIQRNANYPQIIARIACQTTAKMAPAPIDPIIPITNTKAPPKPKKDLDLPAPARQRLEKAGIDLSEGYPY